MGHFFDRRDPWGNRFSLYVVLGMFFLMPLAWWSLKQIRLENDVENWLPADDPELKVLRWTHTQFPVDERIFVTWQGSALGDPRVAELASKLTGILDSEGIKRTGPVEVSGVIQPRDVLDNILKSNVPYHEAIRRMEGTLVGAGPLRLRLTDFGAEQLSRTRTDLAAQAKAKFGIDLTVTTISERQQDDLLPSLVLPAFAGADTSETRSPTEAPTEARTAAVLAADKSLLDSTTLKHHLAVTWPGMRPGQAETEKIAEWFVQTISLGSAHSRLVKAKTGTESGGAVASGAGEKLVEQAFFIPGSPVALAVALSKAGLADKQTAFSKIRAAAASVGIPPDDLKLAGSAVAGSELNREVKNAAWNSAAPITELHKRSVILLSNLVGAVLAFILLKSLRLAAIVLFASVYVTFVTVALVPVTGGSMNMVLVVMPTLLLVLTLSGSIHLANYWKHAAAVDSSTAVSRSCQAAMMPCFLASLTTAIGLISLCTSSLVPVRDFGLYAAIGTMISLVVTLYGVPALLDLWPGRAPKAEELDHAGWRALGRILTIRPNLQAGGLLALSALASYGLVYFQTETKVIRFFPDSSRVVQDYKFIEGQLAGILPVEMVIQFDEQAQGEMNFASRLEVVRRIEERMRGHEEITGSISLADFFPVTQAPAAGSGQLAWATYNKRGNIIESKVRGEEFPGAKAFYRVASDGADFAKTGDNQLNQPGDELWRITAQVLCLPQNDIQQITADLDKLAKDELKLHAGTRHLITGTVPLFLRTQRAVLDSLVNSFGLAFALILGVMVVLLRSFWAGLVSMIPNVVPVTVVFGLVSWAGERVDIGSMITASVALGIAVDGTLHYLSWFQRKLGEGMSRQDAVVDALAHCGPAIWQTSLAVALGLVMLMPAELLLISRFGWLMAALVAVALLGDILLLPTLLAGPLGKLFLPTDPDGISADAVERDDVAQPGVLLVPVLHAAATSRDTSAA